MASNVIDQNNSIQLDCMIVWSSTSLEGIDQCLKFF